MSKVCSYTDPYIISKAIRRKREEMIASAKMFGFTNEKTIQYSQELDKLINEYHRCFRQRENEYVIKAEGNFVTIFNKQFAYV